LFLRRIADFGSFAVNAKKDSYSRFSIVPGRRNLLDSHARRGVQAFDGLQST